MRGEDDPEQLESELPGIGVRFQVPFVDGNADRLGDGAAQLALPGDEQVAHCTGPIVIFGGGGEHETAAGEVVVAFHPREPVREKGPETRQATGVFQCGRQNLVEEQRLRPLEREQLQVLLGAAMSEEPALGHVQPFREGAYAQPLQPELTCQGHRLVEDQRARLLAFSHPHTLVRTFVNRNYFFFFYELPDLPTCLGSSVPPHPVGRPRRYSGTGP